MLKVQSAAESIADALRNEIRQGQVSPGAALRQEGLATRFKVSRIPIREALRVLERDGLVQVFPNRGAFVVQLTAAEMEEITDLRVLLEGDLIESAVTLLDASDILKIKEAERIAKDRAHTAEWIDADRAFHACLYAPANKTKQLQLVFSLRTELERYQSAYSQLPRQKNRWLREHHDIVVACDQRDASKARAVLVKHIRAAGSLLHRYALDEGAETST